MPSIATGNSCCHSSRINPRFISVRAPGLPAHCFELVFRQVQVVWCTAVFPTHNDGCWFLLQTQSFATHLLIFLRAHCSLRRTLIELRKVADRPHKTGQIPLRTDAWPRSNLRGLISTYFDYFSYPMVGVDKALPLRYYSACMLPKHHLLCILTPPTDFKLHPLYWQPFCFSFIIAVCFLLFLLSTIVECSMLVRCHFDRIIMIAISHMKSTYKVAFFIFC